MPIFPSNKNDESDVLNICYKNDSADLQSDLEKSNPQIETNLDQPQLIFFRSYDEDKQSCLSLCSDEKIIWIKIPKKYLNFNLYISVILPDEDKKHDLLKLVSLHTYPIHHGEIVLKITEENLTNLRLDFFGIQFIDDQLINTGIDDPYKRNTARLFIQIYDNFENLVKFFKSQIIRNKNYEVSEDIIISEILRENDKQFLIKLKHSVPYFPKEIVVDIEGYKKNFPITETVFPIKEIIIDDLEKYERIEDKINIYTSFSEKRTAEMCFVINQIDFDSNRNLPSRKNGSEEDIKAIENFFSKTLNYKVHIFKSLTTKTLKKEIQDKLNDFKNYHDHIVVFVSSHGDNNMFDTYDGSIKYDDLVKLFSSINSRQKSNKPILFFISCCQGKKFNLLKKSSVTKDFNESKSARCENFYKIKNLPECPNIFIGFSTVPGYYNIRWDNGTPYIQKLLKVISQNPKLDITHIQSITQLEMKKESIRLAIPCSYEWLDNSVYLKLTRKN